MRQHQPRWHVPKDHVPYLRIMWVCCQSHWIQEDLFRNKCAYNLSFASSQILEKELWSPHGTFGGLWIGIHTMQTKKCNFIFIFDLVQDMSASVPSSLERFPCPFEKYRDKKRFVLTILVNRKNKNLGVKQKQSVYEWSFSSYFKAAPKALQIQHC